MVLKKPKPKPKPPQPTGPSGPTGPVQPPPTPTPPTSTSTDLQRLTGAVRTFRPNSSNAFNVPWSNITRFEPWFTTEAQSAHVDPFLMAAMAIVESDGNHYWPESGAVIEVHDRFGGGPSVGILQIKPYYWQSLDPKANAYEPHGNIRLGCKLMAAFIREVGTWPNAIRQKYHPGTSGAGTTPQHYVDTVTSLMAEILNNVELPPSPKPEPPTPQPAKDPISVIVGGVTYGRLDYGFLSDAGLNYYAYGVGHGTTRATQHTGVDVPVPDETPLYSPLNGKVLCVGEAGANVWGQGCGFFADVMGGGVGNITILGDTGLKLTLGHCSRAFVKPGQRVNAGERVGTSGGMNGYHVHVETLVEKNGTYLLVEPIAALKQAMKGTTVTPPDPTPVYAERVPIPQPGKIENPVTVTATQDGVPVLQYADPAAKPVRWPLKKGEAFEAAYQVVGVNGDIWWVSSMGSRIPVDGTDGTGWKG